MAKSFVISDAARTAACNAIVDLVDTSAPGSVAIYEGTGSGTTLLVSIDLASPAAFGNAATGVATMTAGTYTGTAGTGVSGTAQSFRLRDGADALIAYGNVSTTGALYTMQITNTSINASDQVQLTAMTVTVPAGT